MTRRAERALVRRVLAGDRDAAESLVKSFQESLYAFMLRISGRPEIAEDVVQEAFVRALTNLSRYDDRFRFSTWLFTIAKRLYVNAQQRLAPAYDTDTVGAAPSRSADEVSAYHAGETSAGARSALQHAMAALSEDQREVVVLFYQLDWSVEQMSEYLDLPPGTVKSHLHRARARLRDALETSEALMAPIREIVA
ncbi:MAG: sigma-70 family RNA polymerase sigma factor [Phycisphaeraceae bacterium]|nr:sigma-70 family RNA polymerase sigma factor [Phycisphaeraceae bacterium]